LEEQLVVTKQELEEAKLPHPPWIGFEVTASCSVQSVMQNSPASDAGVLVGDKCLRVGDTPVNDLDSFRAAILGKVLPGMTVPFAVQRGEKTMVLLINVRSITMRPSEQLNSIMSTGELPTSRTQSMVRASPPNLKEMTIQSKKVK